MKRSGKKSAPRGAAAKPTKEERQRIAAIKKRIEHAQRLVRQYVKPGVSIVDEFIAERPPSANSINRVLAMEPTVDT